MFWRYSPLLPLSWSRIDRFVDSQILLFYGYDSRVTVVSNFYTTNYNVTKIVQKLSCHVTAAKIHVVNLHHVFWALKQWSSDSHQ